MLMVAAYKKFATHNDIQWILPRYEINRKLPFIPLEKEIDDLIASCGKRMSTVLQLLKDTGIRIGEALDLQWTDIYFERKMILLNRPEKHGNARTLKISDKLITMLNRLPNVSNKIFPNRTKATIANNFNRQRKNAAHKLGNPRLLRIHFHTFRHFKATMEYSRTKDIIHVMHLLGHRSIANTLLYTQLIEFKEEDYHSTIANNIEEAKQLVSLGFEFVCSHNGFMLFRKHK
jgi:integrase